MQRPKWVKKILIGLETHCYQLQLTTFRKSSEGGLKIIRWIMVTLILLELQNKA